jgi:hypothetical protein
MFATFILVLFYRYDRVIASLWIRYPGILLGEGLQLASVHLQIILWLRNTNKLFWRCCRGSQLILSICRVNMIQLVNTISLCRMIFCSILFVVLIEMCWTGFDHPAIYHTVRLLVNLWRASSLGHDLKLLIENLSDPAPLGMISDDHWWTHHRGMGKPSELYSEVSRGGKQVYHPTIFLGWVEQSADTLMLRHEDHFIEKMVF